MASEQRGNKGKGKGWLFACGEERETGNNLYKMYMTQRWKTKCKRGNSLVFGCKQLLPLAGMPQKIFSGRKNFIVSGTLESKSSDIDELIIGITSVSLLPLESFADFSPCLWVGILKALVPSIAMNIYVVGLNQLFDIEIDKVNKPNLPLAAGEFSMESGIAIVSTFLLMFCPGDPVSVATSVFYSRSEFSHGKCIFCRVAYTEMEKERISFCNVHSHCQTIVVQFAFFIHIQKVILRIPVIFTRSLICAAAFMSLFTIVIALFKDSHFNRTYPMWMVMETSASSRSVSVLVFSLCVGTLLLAYGAAIAVGASCSVLMSKLITVLAHFSFAFPGAVCQCL
ncbi:hypothetical protein Leryth_000813 [Lithospermum erythrorhizon]|nr:hypothetical protein Leryth_000813 [Lithospermum erythrorhizon]